MLWKKKKSWVGSRDHVFILIMNYTLTDKNLLFPLPSSTWYSVSKVLETHSILNYDLHALLLQIADFNSQMFFLTVIFIFCLSFGPANAWLSMKLPIKTWIPLIKLLITRSLLRQPRCKFAICWKMHVIGVQFNQGYSTLSLSLSTIKPCIFKFWWVKKC